MPFFLSFWVSLFFCPNNKWLSLSHRPQSLGLSLLINLTIRFIRYIILQCHKKHMLVTMMTGLLGDGRNDLVLCTGVLILWQKDIQISVWPWATSSPVYVTHTAFCWFSSLAVSSLSVSSCPYESYFQIWLAASWIPFATHNECYKAQERWYG